MSARVGFMVLFSNLPINLPTCQRRAIISTWCPNVSNACQFFSLLLRSVKSVAIFQLRLPKRRANFTTIFQKKTENGAQDDV